MVRGEKLYSQVYGQGIWVLFKDDRDDLLNLTYGGLLYYVEVPEIVFERKIKSDSITCKIGFAHEILWLQ